MSKDFSRCLVFYIPGAKCDIKWVNIFSAIWMWWRESKWIVWRFVCLLGVLVMQKSSTNPRDALFTFTRIQTFNFFYSRRVNGAYSLGFLVHLSKIQLEFTSRNHIIYLDFQKLWYIFFISFKATLLWTKLFLLESYVNKLKGNNHPRFYRPLSLVSVIEFVGYPIQAANLKCFSFRHNFISTLLKPQSFKEFCCA